MKMKNVLSFLVIATLLLCAQSRPDGTSPSSASGVASAITAGMEKANTTVTNAAAAAQSTAQKIATGADASRTSVKDSFASAFNDPIQTMLAIPKLAVNRAETLFEGFFSG